MLRPWPPGKSRPIGVSGCVLAAVLVMGVPAGGAAQESAPPRSAAARLAADAGGGALQDVEGPGAEPGVQDPEGSLLDEFSLLKTSFLHSFTSPMDWDEQAWQALPSWVAGIAGISMMDEWVRERSFRPVSSEVDAVLDFVEPLGAEGSFAVMGGFYAAGVALDDRRARRVAIEGLAASALAGGVITPTLQRIVGRTRPRQSPETYEFEPFSGNLGFPSGHVTQAFAVASVIATEYDAWWVDGLAYGAASGVAMHRMVHGAHHLSDVATGALIGTVVGRCVARFGRGQRSERVVRPFSELGVSEGTAVGVSVAF